MKHALKVALACGTVTAFCMTGAASAGVVETAMVGVAEATRMARRLPA
ncbi:hypothetical protein OKW49_002824 [Paraburkholderia youngii]